MEVIPLPRPDHRRSRRSKPWLGDQGAGALEYLAVILLVASIAAALAVSALPTQITGDIEAAVCRVAGDDCATGTHAGPADDLPGLNAPAGPTDPDATTGGTAQPEYHYWDCGWLGQAACDMAQGFGGASKKAVVETVEGGATLLCMVHICSHTKFKETYSGFGYFFTHPGDSAMAIWDDSTKTIREHWKNGHQGAAVAAVVPTILGKVFGDKGLAVPKLLHDAEKLAKLASDARKAAEKAAELAEEAARRGDLKAAKKQAEEAQRHFDEASQAHAANPTGESDEESLKAFKALKRAENAVIDAGVRNVLLQSGLGQSLLKILDEYGVRVEYGTALGSGYRRKDNSIYINVMDSEKSDPANLALLLTHEASHARSHHVARTPNVRDVSREEFVRSMLDEEAEAVMAEIDVARQLREQKVKIPGRQAFNQTYLKAYERAIARAQAERKSKGLEPLSDFEKYKIGKETVRDIIRETSQPGTGQSFERAYGEMWDRANGQGS